MSNSEEPFMEHPTGEFPNAVSAMESAIARLRALDPWDRWITFCGQGQGSHPDSYHVAEVQLCGDEIRSDEPNLDVSTILKVGNLEKGEIDIRVVEEGVLRVQRATAAQLARVLDGLFRGQLGVREFEDEGDYAVGAEWFEGAE